MKMTPETWRRVAYRIVVNTTEHLTEDDRKILLNFAASGDGVVTPCISYTEQYRRVEAT